MPSTPADDKTERRAFIWVAVGFTVLLVVATGAFVLIGTPQQQQANGGATSAQRNDMPAFDQPNSGHAPTSPGDRGGWEQLALLGLLVAAFAGGTASLVVSSRRTRRRLAAAGSGTVTRAPGPQERLRQPAITDPAAPPGGSVTPAPGPQERLRQPAITDPAAPPGGSAASGLGEEGRHGAADDRGGSD